MSTVSLPAPGQVWEETLAAVNRRPMILALLVVLFGLQISTLLYPTPDAVGYLSIARSIARAHVLANRGSPQLYYSVGYPLLISPVFCFGDRPFLLLSAIHAGLALAYLAGVYVWAGRACLPPPFGSRCWSPSISRSWPSIAERSARVFSWSS